MVFAKQVLKLLGQLARAFLEPELFRASRKLQGAQKLSLGCDFKSWRALCCCRMSSQSGQLPHDVLYRHSRQQLSMPLHADSRQVG